VADKTGISVNQAPAYGDKAALDRFRSSTKPLPVSGAATPKQGPGRPTGTTAPAASPGAEGQPVPQEHKSAFQRLHDAEVVVEFWQQMAQMAPTARNLVYLRNAKAVAEQIALHTYKNTPNFLEG
jgi:hypothetical protein